MSKEWEAEFEVQKLLARQAPEVAPASYVGKYKHINEDEYISPEQWREAMSKAAALVKRFGMEYAPLFTRAKEEYEKSLSSMSLMDEINLMATPNNLDTQRATL